MEGGRLPTHTDAWIDACLETWSSRVELVEVDGAAITLVRDRSLSDFVGHQLWEPGDAVWRDDASAHDLARVLRSRPIRLTRLLADSPLVAALPRAIVRPAAGSPVVRLHEGWTAPEGALSSRRASDLRRARRRASGEVAFEVLAPSPEDVDAAIARVAAVEDASWKGASGTSLARDETRARFFRAYGRRAAADGSFRCAFLTIGGEDAAAHLGLEWGGAYWLFKIGFDERFGRVSPGQLLMLESIRDAAARGLERYEFLGADAAWTQMWTDEVRRTVTLLSFPATPAGIAAAGIQAARMLRGRGK